MANSGDALLQAKDRDGAPAAVAIRQYDNDGQRAKGPHAARVLANGNREAVIEFGTRAAEGKTVKVAYRLGADKHWVEAKPVENAGRVGVGVKSQLVIAPSRFGEDFICDSSKQQPGATIPLPHDNLAVVLNCDGDFMSVLTYPSLQQAGDVVIASDGPVNNHGRLVSPSVAEVNARFHGKSVFIGLLPHRGNWHFERINKVYSSSGQYISGWSPPYPGAWRLAGRVGGRYRTNDVLDGRFVFACSWSGAFEYLFMYLSAPTQDTPPNVATPMQVYAETLGAGPNAYLTDTEQPSAGRAAPRRTKHRDVCGTVNDLKETWKDYLVRIEKDPGYVPNLTADAKAIVERMESRLSEYRGLSEALAPLCAEMNAARGGAEFVEFARAVQACRQELEGVKAPRHLYARQVADQIEQIAREQPERLRTDRQHLDLLAEEVRSVASAQEGTLKQYRKIASRLSSLCQQKRGAEQQEWERYAAAIGKLCRKVLRNRDPEE
jgi:hypothetical protein